MKRSFIFLILLALLVLPLGFAQAGDPPLNSPDDNACFEGGAMYRPNQVAGGCPDEWHWICGWYLARYRIQNLDWRSEYMPDQCRILADLQNQASGGVPVPTLICVVRSAGVAPSILYNPATLLGDVYEADCLGIPSLIGVTYVPFDLANPGAATAQCVGQGFTTATPLIGFITLSLAECS